jgi:hypothetical protein
MSGCGGVGLGGVGVERKGEGDFFFLEGEVSLQNSAIERTIPFFNNDR